MRAWVFGVSLALAAAIPPVQAAPPAEGPSEVYEEPGYKPPASQWRRDQRRMKPGGRCRSEADEKATAEEFCENQLQCSSMTPPKTISCSGQPGRWICTCV